MMCKILTIFIVLFLPTLAAWAEEATEKKITFDEHIKPIFREHCTTCHSEGEKESDLALDSYGGSLAGGSSGVVIAEGNTGSSRLFALLTHAERPFMPPDQDAIPKEQIELVKQWIEQGMPENAGSKIKRSNSAAGAMLSTTSVGKPEGPPPMPESLLRQPITQTLRSSAIAAMAASPWAPLLTVGGQQQVSCYNSETGEFLGVYPFPEGEPQSLTFTRDGKQLLIGGGRHSQSGCAVLVDVATGDRIAKVGDELDIVLAADISPNKKEIAIAGPQKIIRVFDSLSGELRLEMKKHTDWIFALRYSPDGVLIATGDRSNGLIVWEADTGRVYAELSGHAGEVRSLDFRADSNVLASGSLDGTIKLWDMYESKEIKSWAAHGGGVTSVAFAQNGLIASAGQDGRIKLWNGNGELQKEFSGFGEAALEVALTGDGSFVAGGDWNGQVQLWPAADPSQAKLIAANPPSIEKRLERASDTLATLQIEFDSAERAANELAAAAEAVQEKRAEAAARLEMARSEREKALADKAALDAKSIQLRQLLDETNATASKLSAEVAAAIDQQQSQQAAVERLSNDVQLLAEQLALLQQRFEAVKQAREQAQQDLGEMQNSAVDLKSQLEAAEQAALEAQEHWMLFREAYGPSN